MIFKARHLALQTGYQLAADLPHGFTLCLFGREARAGVPNFPRYRWIIHASWNRRPTIVWRNKHWHLNEIGMVSGLPILRQQPLRWWQMVERVSWEHCFRFDRYGND